MNLLGVQDLLKRWGMPAALVLFSISLASAATAFEHEIPVRGLVKSPVITIRNLGTSGVLSPRILLNGEPDDVSVEKMARDICRSSKTDREKAEALWDFVRRRTIHSCPDVAVPGRVSYDALTVLNEMGYGCCDQVAPALAALWRGAGLKSRLAIMGFHTVPEVFYEDGWHLYDPDHKLYYLLEDGRTVASAWQLACKPERVAETPDPSGVDAAWMASKYEADGPNARYVEIQDPPPDASFWLPPRSSLTFAVTASRLKRSDLRPVSTDPMIPPPNFSVARFHGVLKFGDPGWPVYLRSTEIRDGRLGLVLGAAHGTAVVAIAGPGAALTGSLSLPYSLGKGSHLRVWLSGNPDLPGWPVAEIAGPKTGVLRTLLQRPLGSIRERRFFVGLELEGDPSSARVGPDLEIETEMQWSFSALGPQRAGIVTARYRDDSGEIARDLQVTIGNRLLPLKSSGGSSFWEWESSADGGRAAWRGYLEKPREEIRKRLPVPQGRQPSECVLLALVSGTAAEKDHGNFDAVFSLEGHVLLTTPVPSLEGIRWLRVPFDPTLLRGKKDVDARISLRGDPGKATGYLEVFGSGAEFGESTFNGRSDDLSRDPGTQSGEFMVRIRCQGPRL